MLSQLLGAKKAKEVDDLFSRKLEIVDAKEETQEHDDEVVEPKLKARRANASESTPQEKEVELRRKCRTLFVGNLDINAQNKDIIKLFKAYGQIEKVWFRSIPVDRTTKTQKSQLPIKAAVLMQKYQEGAKTKNCYILFEDPKAAKAALAMDGHVYNTFHLRCSLEGQKKMDHLRTAFVGNLPFDIEEEEVREAFQQFGEIAYVRVIKDPYTHKGKGFGYVSFKEFGSLKRALQAETVQVKDREVRIKKASEQTKTAVQSNPKNAFRRISERQQPGEGKANGVKAKKGGQNLQIKKKIKKMRKKNYNPKQISKQIENIKREGKKQVKDTNIFNQH